MGKFLKFILLYSEDNVLMLILENIYYAADDRQVTPGHNSPLADKPQRKSFRLDDSSEAVQNGRYLRYKDRCILCDSPFTYRDWIKRGTIKYNTG